MKLHLIDKINNYNEFYELDNSFGYREVWKEIDKIIELKNYSCQGFSIPKIEIDNGENIITIHWIELFGDLSISYIEIIECTEQLIEIFRLQIRQCLKRKEREKERRNKKNERVKKENNV